jgi:concanavalin A-like lectin/glucanase superfamily protein
VGAREFAAAVVLAGCGFNPVVSADGGNDATDAPASAWLAGYSYRRPIHVTPSIGSTLVDFPLGIVRGADAQLAMHATGDDLVVTASDAQTVLPRELVGFGTDGSFELWVKLPALGPGATTLYLYYGGAAMPSSTAVWSAYAGVWHLSETTPNANDSSANGNNLAAPGPMQRPTSGPGIAGGARVFDGADDAIGVMDPPDGSLDVGLGSFSFSAWVNVTPTAAIFETPLWKGGTSTGEHGYCFLVGNGVWNAKVHDGTTYIDPALSPTPIAGWVQIVGVLDRGAQTFAAYANGRPTETLPIGGLGTLDTNIAFDLSRETISPFHGSLDEARVIKSVLSPDWIAADYANLTDAGFVALDPEQTR